MAVVRATQPGNIPSQRLVQVIPSLWMACAPRIVQNQKAAKTGNRTAANRQGWIVRFFAERLLRLHGTILGFNDCLQPRLDARGGF